MEIKTKTNKQKYNVTEMKNEECLYAFEGLISRVDTAGQRISAFNKILENQREQNLKKKKNQYTQEPCDNCKM